MNIKTKLLLSAAFLIGAITAIGIIVTISTQKVQRASQREIVANDLVKEVFTLNALTVDYRLHQGDRASLQWNIQYQQITMLLRNPAIISDATSQKYIADIEYNLRESQKTFNELRTAKTHAASGLEERVLGQLQIDLQAVVDGASAVASHAQQESETIKQLADRLLFFFIVVGDIIMVLTTYIFYRSVVVPVNRLSSVVKQIQQGDLTKRATISSRDEIGQFASTFNTMLDALKESHEHLEQKVQERTQELQTANKDLESFSYSVSHDLRAPLRAIDGFSQILEEDYLAKLDDKGKETIATIRNSTHQMGRLIDDLLAFSRLGRKAIQTETVEMTPLVQEVFTELHQADPDRSIQFTCEALPPAQVDPGLFRQVWVNLLSNAIKYTKKQAQATITVGSLVQEEKTVYFVKDNGAGFDMKYVDKLFGVFQRLHSPTEFEGTGVGLAIVARIITKHGGKVWAEGEVNKGATFYFSLPKTA